ncbi:hypothetical protein NDU88_002596 [Pleurodeles waltl]|uniref:Uncharacterized protein n=1 Tax=Pleurodeles waltl TaxID=8319 RepID=A0AAV7MNL2_PLEWA|nr:hypothetical protein NDU88_002596 [Pleurodeles waltl]
MVSVRFSGATHSVPAIPRPAKQGPAGSGATRIHLTGGNTCGPDSTAIPRLQSVEGPMGDQGDPRRTRAARSGKARGSIQGPRRRPASQDIQWSPGPGFFSARLRDSRIHQAGPADGLRSLRASARSSQALLRFTRQGPAGTKLTPQGGGAPSAAVPAAGRRALAGAPGVLASHALLPQSNARRDRARPATPGNSVGAASTLPAPPRAPHPPGRSSPKCARW